MLCDWLKFWSLTFVAVNTALVPELQEVSSDRISYASVDMYCAGLLYCQWLGMDIVRHNLRALSPAESELLGGMLHENPKRRLKPAQVINKLQRILFCEGLKYVDQTQLQKWIQESRVKIMKELCHRPLHVIDILRLEFLSSENHVIDALLDRVDDNDDNNGDDIPGPAPEVRVDMESMIDVCVERTISCNDH